MANIDVGCQYGRHTVKDLNSLSLHNKGTSPFADRRDRDTEYLFTVLPLTWVTFLQEGRLTGSHLCLSGVLGLSLVVVPGEVRKIQRWRKGVSKP